MSQASGTDVTKNNERLFKMYEKNLKIPTIKEYGSTATKLAEWLSVDRAYYPAARPIIVNLLITAQITLRQEVQQTPELQVPFAPTEFLHHPLTASYVRLVATIRPFRQRFVEPHLQDAVSSMLQSIEGIPLQSMSFSAPQNVPQNRQPLLTSASASENSVPQVVLGTRQSSSMPEPAGKEMRKSPSPEIVYLGTSRKEPVEHTAQSDAVSTALPKDDTSKPVNKVKPKRKKKVDLSVFVQSDLQDFERRQQARTLTSMGSVSSIKKEPESEQVPTATHDAQKTPSVVSSSGAQDKELAALVSPGYPSPVVPTQREATQNRAFPVQSPDPIVSRPLTGRTAELQTVPSDHQLSAGSNDAISQKLQHTSSQILPSSVVHSSTSYPVPPGSQTFSQTKNVFPTPSTTLSHLQQHTTNPTIQISQSTNQTPPVAPTAPAPYITGQQPVESPDAQDISAGQQPFVPGSNLISAEQDHESGNNTSITDKVQTIPLKATEQLEQERNENSLNSATELTQAVKTLIISESSDLGRLFKWHEEYESAKSPTDHDGHLKDVEMTSLPEKEQINCAMGLAHDVATLEAQAQAPSKLIHIIALSPGHPTDTHYEFVFDITDSDMHPLSKWINRSKMRLSELTTSSHCISLGCYSTQELGKLVGDKIKATSGSADVVLTNVVQTLSSAWPRDGGLFMNVNFLGGRKDLPLSPPILDTCDGLVDVSEFIVPGKNSLHIRQQGKDFSDCIFVLWVHRPTFSQLQEVVEYRRKEVEWREWLGKMTCPIKTSTLEHILSPC